MPTGAAGRRMTQGRVAMITSRMRGVVIGALLASCAALPATAQAATPTLTTTTKCLDPQAPTDQYVDVRATGLTPGASYYPLLDPTEAPDGHDEDASATTGSIDAAASANLASPVWFD